MYQSCHWRTQNYIKETETEWLHWFNISILIHYLSQKLMLFQKYTSLMCPLDLDQMAVPYITSFLHNLLSKCHNDEPHYYVRNSLEFINKIQHVSITYDHLLFSLDVVSLFSSIPINLVIDSIQSQWHILQIRIYFSSRNDLC